MIDAWGAALPQLWRRGRLDQVATAWTSNVDKHTVDGQVPARLCNYTDVYKNDSIVEGMEFMQATATADQMARFRLAVGDTVITKDSETADDIGIPAFVRYEAPDLVCGYHLAIVRPTAAMHPRYLYWVLASRPTMSQWAVVASGVTRVGIRSTDLTKLAIPVPPLDEQRAIADYLDRETAQIDELIAEQQRLVNLLNERRVSVVDQAFGLTGDRTVVKHLLAAGPSNGRSPESIQEGGQKSLSIGAVRQGVVRFEEGVTKYVDARDLSDLDSLRLQPGDVLIVRGNGNPDLVGRAGLVGKGLHAEDYIYPDLLIRVRTNACMLPDFFVWAFNAGQTRAQIRALARTAVGTFKISGADIRGLFLPQPPLEEQRRIAAYLEQQTSRMDTLIAESAKLVELAQERRSALITAAVTGQIDVRYGSRMEPTTGVGDPTEHTADTLGDVVGERAVAV